MDMFNKISAFCKKFVYIALCALLLMVMADRVRAEETINVPTPAAITVEALTDENTGLTKVTVYIRSLIQDVQSTFNELVDTSTSGATDGPEAPKAS